MTDVPEVHFLSGHSVYVSEQVSST